MVVLFVDLCVISFLFYLYLRTTREMQRIEAVSKSPILNFYSEIIRGITFCRNCLQRDVLYSKQESNIELDLSNQIIIYAMNNWLILYSNIIHVFFGGVMIIAGYMDPNINYGLLMLSLVTGMTMASFFVNSLQHFGLMNLSMVNFERCHYLATKTPIEMDEHPIAYFDE